MKKGILGKILGLTLSAVLVVSSSIPSIAAEDSFAELAEEVAVEEIQEEFTEDYEESFADEVVEEATDAWEETEDAFEDDSEESAETELLEEDVVIDEEPSQEPSDEPEDPSEEFKWEKDKYTFVLHNKIGKKDTTKKFTITYADKDKTFGDVFKRTGYKLVDWYLISGENTAYADPDSTVDNMLRTLALNGKTKVDLYAEWEQYRYTIVFCDAEGNKLEKQPSGFDSSFEYEDSVDFLAAATEISENMTEDVNIVGFSRTKGGKKDFELGRKYSRLPVADGEEIALYPVFGDGEYSIYYSIDPSATIAKNVTSYKTGNRVVLPKAKMTGCNFLGWLPCNAKGELLESGLEDVFDYKEVTDSYGDVKKVVVAIKKTAKQTIRLCPVWNPITYKLNVAPNAKGVKLGEKAFSKKLYIGTFNYYGEMVKDDGYDMMSDPERKGYRFVGYSLDPKAKTVEECINVEDESAFAALTTKKSVTFYCVWEALTYSVSYSNLAYVIDRTTARKIEECDAVEALIDETLGAEDAVKVETLEYGSTHKLQPINIPGCTFLGWFPVAGTEASVTKNKNGLITKVNADNEADFGVLGVYTENVYKLTFNTNGGVIEVDKNGKLVPVKGKVNLLDEKYALPITNPAAIEKAIDKFSKSVTREGYTFKGLALDAKGKNMITAETDLRTLAKKSNSAVTIYAVWEKN